MPLTTHKMEAPSLNVSGYRSCCKRRQICSWLIASFTSPRPPHSIWTIATVRTTEIHISSHWWNVSASGPFVHTLQLVLRCPTSPFEHWNPVASTLFTVLDPMLMQEGSHIKAFNGTYSGVGLRKGWTAKWRTANWTSLRSARFLENIVGPSSVTAKQWIDNVRKAIGWT